MMDPPLSRRRLLLATPAAALLPAAAHASAQAPAATLPPPGGGDVLLTAFGAIADNRTDCYPAFVAAMAHLVRRAGTGTYFYEGAPRLRLPAAPMAYFFSRTLDLKEVCLILEGDGGFMAGEAATVLRFPPNTTGIRLQRFDTAGTGVAPGTKGSDGSIVRHLAVTGGGGSGAHDGIHIRNHGSTIEDVVVSGFAQDGIRIHAGGGSGGATEGNANNWKVRDCYLVRNGRAGLWVQGADANAGYAMGVDASFNGQYGIYDASFLGNSYIACHTEYNGVPLAGPGEGLGRTGQVSHGGHRYSLKDGQAAAAAQNAPSGSAASNAWWHYVAPGGVVPGYYPAWTRGMQGLVEAGAYVTTDNNAQNLFLGCYAEGSQPPIKLVHPSLMIGGSNGVGMVGSGAAIGNRLGAVHSASGFSANRESSGGDQVNAMLGGDAENKAFLQMTSSDHPATWQLKSAAGDIALDYGGLGPNARGFAVTGASTQQRFGSSAVQPYVLSVRQIAVGGRRQTAAEGPPTAGAWAQGDYCRNSAPAIGRPKGWICTAGGTPGTWVSEGNL
jgi:hypothetical protein